MKNAERHLLALAASKAKARRFLPEPERLTGFGDSALFAEPDEEFDPICGDCQGTGEGYGFGRCGICGGSGEVLSAARIENNRQDAEDRAAERYEESRL